MSLTLSPTARQQQVDDEGIPYSGGKLYTYEAGTDTPATTWQDADQLVANTNPVIADSAGRFPAIYLSASSYKFEFFDQDDVPVWTQDGIASVALVSGTIGLGQAFLGDPTSPISATSYPSGSTFDKCHAGTVILPIDSANLSGTYELGGMLLASGGTVTAALVNLSDGAPDTPLVTITGGSVTGSYVQSGAITFAAPGVAKNYAIKVKVSAGVGQAWGIVLAKVA